MITIHIPLSPGDLGRLEEVARELNRPILAGGGDPLSDEDVASHLLRQALLAAFRAMQPADQ